MKTMISMHILGVYTLLHLMLNILIILWVLSVFHILPIHCLKSW